MVNSGFGIFTSVSGTAPNRIFNIEWRAQYFPGSGSAGFELRLYEGQCRFDVIYGTVSGEQHQRHCRSAEERQCFCAGLLQWVRWRRYWRSKLYPDTLRNALTNTIADRIADTIVTRGEPDVHANSS